MKANQDLIKKYLQGDCSEKEQEEVLKILAKDDSDLILGELAEKAWAETKDDEATAIDSEKLYHRISKELHSEPSGTRKKYAIKPWLYAACIAIIVIFTFYFTTNQSLSTDNSSSPEMVVKNIPAGMKSTILLNDGSKVVLNSGSTISYPASFTDTSRTITLKGEAYFDVAEDKTRPFSVIASGTITTALGTSFNINSRDSICKISLATGKVMITSQNTGATDTEETIMLSPGEALEVNHAAGTKHKSIFDPNADLLWKDGILYFKEAPLKEVINKLELWYDVEFQFKGNKNLTDKYTGRFENASLAHVLDNMSYVLNFEYLIQGKKVIIIRQTN